MDDGIVASESSDDGVVVDFAQGPRKRLRPHAVTRNFAVFTVEDITAATKVPEADLIGVFGHRVVTEALIHIGVAMLTWSTGLVAHRETEIIRCSL